MIPGNKNRMSGKKILIVDDEHDIGLSLKRVLERNSFSVDYYSQAAEAIDNFKVD